MDALPSETKRRDSKEIISDDFGRFLFERGLISSVQLEYALQRGSVDREVLWRSIIEYGLASERVVARSLAEFLGIAFVEVDSLDDPEPSLMTIFNRELCLNGNFLPLRREATNLVVLLGDAYPDVVAQIVLRRCGLKCRFVLSDFSDVKRFILQTYFFSQYPPEVLFDRQISIIAADSAHELSPESLLRYLLHMAVQERATDVHITPGVKSLHVLFRTDGVLRPIKALPLALLRLLGYIKLLSDMDISEQRRPQDGSFRATILDTQFTMRVSTIVTEHGERMVLRLLPEAHDLKGLKELGFFEEDVDRISMKMANPAGLILITGPTGSGKSSTLHAGLRMQKLIERNVLTVEDPLEYRVPGAGQTEVNRRAGYDFSTALRHFLRHDPDVILVGEMRDAETAQAGLDAAATGHLVLSTLHVTSVFGVVPRLRPLGLQPQVIAENLLLVINQRLVRRNCPFCSEEAPFTASERMWLNLPADRAGVRGRGCPRCRGTGYLGRLPVYEILNIDNVLANAIADDAGREVVRKLAFESGFRDIGEVSKKRIVLGQTTSEEIFRVTGFGPQT